jgi:hypothetical protein
MSPTGLSTLNQYRRAAGYVDRILRASDMSFRRGCAARGSGGYAEFICINVSWVRSSNRTSFGATMKGRTGGLESEGGPEGFGPPSLTG